MRLIFIVNSDKFFVSHWILIARFLMSKGFKIYVLTNYSRHRESILRLGFETIHFPFNRTSANPFVSIYQSIKLAKVFFSYKPTFVYSIGMSSNLTVIFAHLFFFFRNISFVYSITGLGHIFTTRTWSNRLISFFVKIFFYFISLRSNVAFLVENKFLVNLLSSHWFIDKKKIFLVPGAGIDPSYYMCNNFPSFDNSFRVLFFGRLLSEKGINEFYKASLFLSKNAPNVEMIIAGNIDDNPSSISAETLSDWSKQPNITYIGNLINDPHFLCDFHPILRACLDLL